MDHTMSNDTQTQTTTSVDDALIDMLKTHSPHLNDDQLSEIRNEIRRQIERYPGLAMLPEQVAREAVAISTPVIQSIQASEQSTISNVVQHAVRVVALQVTEDPRCRIPEHYQGDSFCPYPGLASFTEQQSVYFFGRNEELEQLLTHVTATIEAPESMTCPVLAVTGISGVGKSSLVHAGLLPQLRTHFEDQVVIFTHRMSASHSPLLHLADSLTKSDSQAQRVLIQEMEQRDDALLSHLQQWGGADRTTIVVIDQFEEIFLGDEPEQNAERKRFLDNLLTIAQSQSKNVSVLLVTRQNFNEHPDYIERPMLRKLIYQDDFFISPLSPRQLRQVIEEPLHKFNQQHGQQVEFQTQLVETIVEEFQSVTSALSLLQYLLRLLWIERNHLTFVAYHHLGRLEQIFDRHATAIYETFDVDERLLVQHLLLSLVRPGLGNEMARKRVKGEDLLPAHADPSTERTLKRALTLLSHGRSRIISQVTIQGESFFEFTHEVLLRRWTLLHTLLETYRERLIQRERLLAAAELWKTSKKDLSYLYRGAALTETQQYIETARHPADLDRRIVDCFEASIQHRRRTRIRTGSASVVGLSIVLLLVIFAIIQLRIVESRRLAGLAQEQRIDAPDVALLLAYESAVLNVNQQSEQALRDALTATAWQSTEIASHQKAVQFSTFSPDGQTLLTASDDGTARLWDTEGNKLAIFKHDPSAIVHSAIFSPDGQNILTAGNDGARLWDRSGKLIRSLINYGGAVSHATFNPDGKEILVVLLMRGEAQRQTLEGEILTTYALDDSQILDAIFSSDGEFVITGGSDGSVQIWSRDGTLLEQFTGHSGNVMSVAVSPDGQRILTAGQDRAARVWDMEGNKTAELTGHKNGVVFATFSPDDHYIITSGMDGTARIWDGDGTPLATLKHQNTTVHSAVMSHDGQFVLTTSGDGKVLVWGERGTPLAVLHGHNDTVWDVQMAPDSLSILTTSQDGTARLWDLSGYQIAELANHGAPIDYGVYSPDGSMVLTASRDGTVRLWDLSGNELAVLSGHVGAVWIAKFSADGQYILTGSSDATARLWDLAGNELAILEGHFNWITDVAFSRDSKKLVTASADGEVRLWDITGHLLVTLMGHTGSISSVVFSPNDQHILTSSDDGTARIWNMEGQELVTLSGHNELVTSAHFSPDGNTVITSSIDGTARLWNQNGELIKLLEGHTGPVLWANFSPDGSSILTVSRDGTARLWSSDGSLKTILRGHTGSVTSGAFSRNGERVITASSDGTIRQYLLSVDELIMAAACRATRTLTAEEQAQFNVRPKLELTHHECSSWSETTFIRNVSQV